jgi:hypothetical protein
VVLCAVGLPGLKVDFELENLFPQNDPDLKFYEQFIEKKGYDNDFINITAYPYDRFFDEDFLMKVDLIRKEIEKNDNVKSVISPLSLPFFVNSPTGLITFPAIHLNQPSRYEKDSLRITESPLHKYYFDGFKSVSIVILHNHFKDPERSESFLKHIQQVLQSSGLEYNMTGRIPAEIEFREAIAFDFFLYLLLAVIVSIIVLFGIYRSPAFILLPVLIGVLSLAVALASLALIGGSISIMTVLLPPLLLFTSTSDAIHLLTASNKLGPQEGIRKVLKPEVK